MNPAPSPYDWVLPVTITPDRYGGVYSGGAWLAFPLDTSTVPDDPFGGDTFAAAWCAEAGDMPVGRGGSPSEAHDDHRAVPDAAAAAFQWSAVSSATASQRSSSEAFSSWTPRNSPPSSISFS